jgi:hypothetical protein
MILPMKEQCVRAVGLAVALTMVGVGARLIWFVDAPAREAPFNVVVGVALIAGSVAVWRAASQLADAW